MTTIAPLKILKASAGSGKTFSLTLHYISLVLINENNYREILAVTFTNKATAEMKERILSVLKGLATGDEGRKTHDFRIRLLQEHPQWNASLLQERAYRIYRKILHDYSRFTVSTIDGFSQKVIRAFTYELNLDSAYKIEMNTTKVKADLTVMLNQLLDDRPDLLQWIIEYAERKIANNESWNYRQQLMSLAGLIFTENFQEFDAQLKVADHRQVFDLLNRQVLQKTEAFLQALSEAIASFQEVYRRCAVDASCMSGKSRNPLVSASKVSSRVASLSVSELKKVLEKFTCLIDNAKAFTDQNKEVCHDLLRDFGPVLFRFRELEGAFPEFVAYQAVRTNLYFLRLLKEMSDLLAQWRRENGAQLISDAQVLLNKLGLDENSDPTFIWEKIGNRYRYFLFDEFQDTSRIQWKNYSPLLINALAQSERQYPEHLIVGDVKQSIYRWRNGDWRILLQEVEQQIMSAFHLDQHTKHTFVQESSLDTNFRSLPNIIRFNNYIFEQIPAKLQALLNEKVLSDSRAGIEDWWESSGNSVLLTKAYANSTQKIPPHKLEDNERVGSVELVYLPIENDRWRRTQVVEAALEKMCEQVGEWILSGRYTPDQIGILVRRNSEAFAVIQRLMAFKNAHACDFEVVSGDALLVGSNDAVKLLLETMRALVFQGEEYLLYRARMTYLYHIVVHGKSFDEDAWLKFRSLDIDVLIGFLPAALIDAWDRLRDQPLVQLAEQLIDIYGIGEENSLHLPYILAFRDIVHAFTLGGERGILQFLEYWEEDGYRVGLPIDGKLQAIEVTTIHKSKGLAYDVVVIPFAAWELDGMANGDFWVATEETPFEQLGRVPLKYNSSLANSLFYKQYYEEMLFSYMDALNTFYVATTRAVEHLYILAPFFKEDGNDKKNAPKEKNEYISDVLYQVLATAQAPFGMQGTQLKIDHVSSKPQQEPDSGHVVSLARYVVSSELDIALEKSGKRSVNDVLMMEKAARYGILAHEIVAAISSLAELDKMLDRYVQEGLIETADRKTLAVEIGRIFREPRIMRWMDGSYKVWNEASIITETGETLRPDKVFSNDEETVVLDFKFTSDDYLEHKSQIDRYKQALYNLGYRNVKGYLYYAKSTSLVEVH